MNRNKFLIILLIVPFMHLPNLTSADPFAYKKIVENKHMKKGLEANAKVLLRGSKKYFFSKPEIKKILEPCYSYIEKLGKNKEGKYKNKNWKFWKESIFIFENNPYSLAAGINAFSSLMQIQGIAQSSVVISQMKGVKNLDGYIEYNRTLTQARDKVFLHLTSLSGTADFQMAMNNYPDGKDKFLDRTEPVFNK